MRIVVGYPWWLTIYWRSSDGVDGESTMGLEDDDVEDMMRYEDVVASCEKHQLLAIL